MLPILHNIWKEKNQYERNVKFCLNRKIYSFLGQLDTSMSCCHEKSLFPNSSSNIHRASENLLNSKILFFFFVTFKVTNHVDPSHQQHHLNRFRYRGV